jgi:uncharacterized protein (TIGR00269 family)
VTSRVAPCDRCEQPSVSFLRYCGQHLCGDDFLAFVDRRIQKQVRKQGGVPANARIAVAASGGKDSTLALHAIHDLTASRRDVELVAITVDEGIEGYRPAGLALAADACRRLGIEHVVKRTRDLAGHDMDAVAALGAPRAQCSYCGVFRRRLLNEAARDVGADVLVTGHNLDDLAQSVLMNLAAGEVERLARLGPHTQTKEDLVPRRMPLRQIPEQEVYLACMLRGLEWHDGECPYAHGAQRTLYRDVLARLEDARPGTRHALLRTYDALRPMLSNLPDRLPVGTCGECGEPASGDVCQACGLADELVALSKARVV